MRVGSQKKFDIGAEMVVCNNVCLLYHYTNNDVFCVEMYDDRLAAMQTQLFDYLWGGAKNMKILSDEGKAKLV